LIAAIARATPLRFSLFIRYALPYERRAAATCLLLLMPPSAVIFDAANAATPR